MAIRNYYEWDGTQWKIAGTFETSNAIFKDFVGLNQLPTDNTMFPFLKIYMDTSQNGIEKPGYYYVKNGLLPFVFGSDFAALMPNTYGYQENGNTLFNNQDGIATTGVVRVNRIENINSDDDIENGQDPKKIIISNAIGTYGGTPIYEKKVGGYLLGGYQYAGLDFESTESPEGHFGLNSDYAVKGFGFTERKPIVLWQNFYNFDKLSDMPTYKIEEGWLHKNDEKVCWVGEGATLGIYEKQFRLEVKNNFPTKNDEKDLENSVGWVLNTWLVSSGLDQRASIGYRYHKEANGSKWTFGNPPKITVNSKILYATNNVFSSSTEISNNKWTEITTKSETKTETIYLDKNGGFPYKESYKWSGKFYSTKNIKYSMISTGPFSFSSFSILTEQVGSDTKLNLDKYKISFLDLEINNCYIPEILPHTVLTLGTPHMNYEYTCYNEADTNNFSTLYCEHSATIDNNYDCGLPHMTSIMENVIKDYKKSRKTTTNRFLPDDPLPDKIGAYQHFVVNANGDKEERFFSKGLFQARSEEEIEEGKAKYLGLFWGLRSQSNDELARYCITLEWNESPISITEE